MLRNDHTIVLVAWALFFFGSSQELEAVTQSTQGPSPNDRNGET